MSEQSAVQDVAPALVAAGPEPLVVVGVGASAGGLKALQRFVGAIPADSGMAYVVITHLDPDRASRMAELLQDRTSIPVTQIVGSTVVQADHVYVIPPDHDLEMRGQTIALRERSERSERVPIDLFFRTLAEAAGPDAIGVVLSGTGADGSAGVRSIREAGGITAAQSPEEAEYAGMPTSAIATGWVDVILPSEEIPAELLRLRQAPSTLHPHGPAGKDVEAELAPIFAALRTRTGHDFSTYKRATVLRRLDRRLLFNGASTLAEYLPLLRGNEAETDALLKDLLISVSSFFRDPDEFEAFAALVPALFEGKGPTDTVRVWVVGCATGEEVYSIAMVLAEHAATLDDSPKIQLFATDIDQKGYTSGRGGLYPTAAIARLTSERLERFFVKEPSGYRIAKPLRECVLFALHNVLRDPPFARMDLISCRNLFIYLQPQAQQQVLETFHYALNPRGLLFLGASESAGDGGLFTPADGADHKIYRRHATSQRVLPRLSSADPKPRSGNGRGGAVAAAVESAADAFSYGTLHVHMLEEYAPPSAIVDEHWQVVHLSAGAGRFLRLHEGVPSGRILDLTEGDLQTALRTGVYQAFELGLPTSRIVSVDGDGTTRQLRVQVRPSNGDGASPEGRFALILFEEMKPQVAAATAPPRSDSERQTVVDMEDQLRRTREQLDSASGAHDRSVAELQTVNEELLSINEEQRAALEELETGREEIQAINEELTTINQEHQSTIEELQRTNADLQNLIESTEIGTVFVDREMRIRRFTPQVAAVFNFAASDHGRGLGDITHRLNYPDLVEDVGRVLASLERSEREVESDGGEWFIVRINPYRSHDGQIDGAVLTFFDHTDQHRLEEELREAKTVAEEANLSKGRFLSTLSHELRTPLSAMMGYADILHIGGVLTPAQVQQVDRITAGGRHLNSMIEQLLEFSRVDRGQLSVQRAVVDARTVATEVEVLVRPLAEGKGLALIVTVPDDAVMLTTDVAKARQVLINLCGNAVKYTAAGTISLTVRQYASRVTFDVIDTGIGIAPEHYGQIFERFWQVDGSLTRADGGLGIGLAAAREYGRLLGGDVEVESEQGKGTTFRFWLPRF